MSGLGFIIILWGLSSVVALPSSSAITYIAPILFGVLLFTFGSCREAYLRGGLSVQLTTLEKSPTTQTLHSKSSKPTGQSLAGITTQPVHQEPTDLNQTTTEQIREYPLEMETHEAAVHEQEQQMHT